MGSFAGKKKGLNATLKDTNTYRTLREKYSTEEEFLEALHNTE